MCRPAAAAAMRRAQCASQPGLVSAFAAQPVCPAVAAVAVAAVAVGPAVAAAVPDLRVGGPALLELRLPVAVAHQWMRPERPWRPACWPSANRFRCPYPRQRCGD